MESWGKAAESFGHVIEHAGPWGLVVVTAIGAAVALVAVLALLGHFGVLYQGRRAEQQNLGLVDRLIAEVDKLAAREAALRAEMERQEQDRDSWRLRAVEFEADVALMRAQLRRAIEVLRAVRDGRMLPSAITEADLAELLR